MQFKHPEILYALLLLVIPIIVHLFQLRRFKKTAFTNVKFLQKVVMQTRKSSQLKKWLTLLTRLGLLTCLILAFAQPFSSKTNKENLENEYVIYLDNSFSMQAKGKDGELLKRAVQDIISEVPSNQKITLFTNDNVYANATISEIRNQLLEIDYSNTNLSYPTAYLKAKQYFSNENSLKQLVFISDFQENQGDLNFDTDSTSFQTNIVKLSPINTNNVSIDSLYVSNHSENYQLHVLIGNTNAETNQSVGLYDNTELLAKSSPDDNGLVVFDIPKDKTIKGILKIEDESLQFDNEFFFSINKPEKINVLSINEANDDFLKKIYSNEEFEFTSVDLKQLSYNTINDNDIVVLNEIETLNSALTSVLEAFMNEGGFIIVIPSNNSAIASYNSLLTKFGISFGNKINNAVTIRNINYNHPLFVDVFNSETDNFQYPNVQSYYPINQSANAVLSFENQRPFVSSASNLFVFSAALSNENSNFKNSPLIVPTIYNMAKQSIKQPKLYYTIGDKNVVSVDSKLNKDEVLKIENEALSYIPLQQNFSNRTDLTIEENPNVSGTYNITENSNILKSISFNYNRNESQLTYKSITNFEGLNTSDSIPEMFSSIKNDSNINQLWKWFVIFALAFLLIEMVILKYLK